MSIRDESGLSLTLSVLDRLLDDDPDIQEEPSPSYSEALNLIIQGVRRDLQFLLNARLLEEKSKLDPFPLTKTSVYNFGLPDITSLRLRAGRDRQELKSAIQEAIQRFEPRLKSIQVTIHEEDPDEYLASYQVEAQLMIEPEPEKLTFDTGIRWENHEFRVVETE